jgi:predicted amidohydrolase YtcJ
MASMGVTVPVADAAGELFLRDVAVDGRRVDVRARGGAIAEVGAGLRPGPGAEVMDGRGGALLPGLHDHHIHLLATAAARASVSVGPGDVEGEVGLVAALRRADAALPHGRWLRAVGYHESVAGDLDRALLDALVPHRPLRVQHRGGARWTLNSAAIDAVDLEGAAPPGAERDAHGRLTGRLHRTDAWLRDRLPHDEPPDLAGLGTALCQCGVTGVTDATPFHRLADLDALADAAATGALPQRVVVMGGPELAGAAFHGPLAPGPVKLVIDDADYPELDTLARQMSDAHRHHRPVAVHCVTRTSVVLALAAWEIAGAPPRDRIEHGSVIPPALHGSMAALGLTVVTQPGFIADRGDQYLADVDPDDLPHLYPCRSLLAAGIRVAGSTDAPYSDIDPWAAIRAAANRTTAGGSVISAVEAVPPMRALQLFLGPPDNPGGPPRTVTPRAPADLCLLGLPLEPALRRLAADDVVWTCVRRSASAG